MAALNVAEPLRLPYPGLRSFRREETDLFFGREDCINAMVDRLAATRFLAVLGSSGAGKSSVVKTGLLDALDLGLMAAAGSGWRVVDFRPGGAPLANLARRLLETGSDNSAPPGGIPESDVALFRAFLARGPRSIAEWCRDGHLPANVNLLLLVDQFEELFRYQDYAGREQAEAFVALLLESARQRQFPIYVAITMRSEYLGACSLIDGLADAISAGIVLIPRMTREQCRSAIVGPTAVCSFKIDDALTNTLLNDLAAFAPWDDRTTRQQLDRIARRADQLPLLQYCLNRMWIQARDRGGGAPIVLTRADYQSIGGLEGALNAHADEVLRALGDDCHATGEAVFRALTEGSTAGDAVRRPLQFCDLVDICHGEAAQVRAVVDAFREPGCNFLAPERDRDGQWALADDTIIDISHESLIRQWKRLSQWVEAEARSRRQWLRLVDRFEDGQPLQRNELANVLTWRAEQNPNAAWARRYGGDFAAVMKFVDASEWQRLRFAPLVMPLFNLAALSMCLVFASGILLLVLHNSTAPPASIHYIGSAAMAISAAFALWRYAGVAISRALIAGAIILVITFAAGGAFVELLLDRGRNNAPFLWNSTFAAPVMVGVMAAFYPRFRNLYVASVLVGSYIIAVLLFNSLTKDTASQGYYTLVGWTLWYVLLGFQLIQPADSSRAPRHDGRLAAFRLALLALTVIYTIGTFADLVLTVADNSIQPPWWWPIQLAEYGATLAVTFGYGLYRYRGLARVAAMRAGLTIFALEFVPSVALMYVLLGHDVPLLQAFHWVGVLLFAPCAVAGLGIFDRTFRTVPAWLGLTVLFAAPYALLVWSFDTGRASISGGLVSLLVLLLALLWIGAIGYRLQRSAAKAASAQAPDAARGDGAAAAPSLSRAAA